MNADPVALVAAAAAGDRSAMDRLLRDHYDRIYGVCRRITGNDADAADAAQEALMSIVRGLGKFDGRSSVATWVYRIATNASLDELRRRRRRPVPSLDDRSPNDATATTRTERHHHETPDPDAGLRIDSIGDRIELDAALEALPEDFRVAIVLRDVGDLDYAEIADTLGIPVGTVKSRIARGRAALAHHLRAGNHDDRYERPMNDP